MARALMFQGTGSDVGKTVLVAGLCRAAMRRGIKVAPFKPQNMSNNAAVARADDGEGEIGRGQWLQAFASKIEPSVHMNPVLLKPQSQIGSQVVVQGKVLGQAKAREYLSLKPKLMSSVLDSFTQVCDGNDLVLVEGAGSPAEVNLRNGDIANMGFASEAGVPVVLIGDIDRGGVMASLVGTHRLLSESDRAWVKGYLINKFRGDVSLFDEGLSIISSHTDWPSFGVLPWVDAVKRLPAEDSVALDQLFSDNMTGLKVVVPALGKIANFDDIDPLLAESSVSVEFIRKGDAFPSDIDLLVLPGSKSTIADLLELRENGWERPIKSFAEQGGQVLGICGGYQMLGKAIRDPLRLESNVEHTVGLGLLDVETVMRPKKHTKNSNPRSVEFGCQLAGYEIHTGETIGPDCERPMVDFGSYTDGAMSLSGNVRGCYLHGLFNADEFRAAFLRQLGTESDGTSFTESIDKALDELAEAIESNLDVDGLLALAKAV